MTPDRHNEIIDLFTQIANREGSYGRMLLQSVRELSDEVHRLRAGISHAISQTQNPLTTKDEVGTALLAILLPEQE